MRAFRRMTPLLTHFGFGCARNRWGSEICPTCGHRPRAGQRSHCIKHRSNRTHRVSIQTSQVRIGQVSSLFSHGVEEIASDGSNQYYRFHVSMTKLGMR
jgi:hypothetical protein